MSNKSAFYNTLPYWKDQPEPPKDEEFTDAFFPPDKNSLLAIGVDGELIDKQQSGINNSKKIDSDKITWKRAKEIFENQKYTLLEGKLELSDEQQGNLKNSYFISATKELINYPNMICQLFKSKEINKEGYFEVILFIDGKFQIVIVDDFLPVNENNELVFSQSKNNEIWICILEKAWAKVNGGYANILQGYISELLEAFTGLPNLIIVNNTVKKEYLFKFLAEAKQKNSIISCRTKLNVEDVGLVNHNSYLLIDILEIQSNGETVQLVELRNPWCNFEFNGYWGNYSALWGNEEKDQVDFDNKDERNFYMCFDDFLTYFSTSDIFYLLNNFYSKSYEMSSADALYGQVFNIYLEKSGLFTASLIKKNWRFNRKNQYKITPSYLAIVKYDPTNKDLNNYFSEYDAKNDSYNDVTLTKYLENGFYLIYAYIDIKHSNIEDEQDFVIKFDSEVKFKHNYTGKDAISNNFSFLKKLIIQSVFDCKKDFNFSENYYSFTSQFMKDGLGHRLVHNPTENWLFYKENTSLINNMFLLSPYDNNEKYFSWFIPPKSTNIILGMCLDSNYVGQFNLTGKFAAISKIPKDYKSEKVDIKKFASKNVAEDYNGLDSYYSFISLSIEKANEILAFDQLNLESEEQSHIEEKYPNIMKVLKENFNNESDNLHWVEVFYADVIFVGQVNEKKEREGIGAVIFQDKDFVIMGEFKEGDLNGKGIVFNKNLNKKIYEGSFVNGEKSGNGVLNLSNGDKYEGEFKNNKYNGKGVYYFKGGKSWSGNFKEGSFDGEGELTVNGKTRKVKLN